MTPPMLYGRDRTKKMQNERIDGAGGTAARKGACEFSASTDHVLIPAQIAPSNLDIFVQVSTLSVELVVSVSMLTCASHMYPNWQS